MTVHGQTKPTTPIPDNLQELQRRLYLSAKKVTKVDPDRMWLITLGLLFRTLECLGKKAVGKPYEGKPHVRFDVAGTGNGSSVIMIPRQSSTLPADRAVEAVCEVDFAFVGCLFVCQPSSQPHGG